MSKQLVEQVKAALVAKGQKWETNEDAFQITGRVAWLLRDQGAKLISKQPHQNGASVNGFKVSHDSIAFPNQRWIDCLQSAGPELNQNTPVWNPTGFSSAMLVEPWDMDLAALWPTSPVVPAPPVAPSLPSHSDALALAIDGLREQLDLINAVVVALHRRFDTLQAQDAPTYDAPYDIRAGWPIGNQKGTLTLTPRKR
jgi:hypothetical protein